MSRAETNILFIGDIVGSSGRRALRNLLPSIKKKYDVDLSIANGENAAHGFGLTLSTAKEIYSAGVDLISGGNHSFDKKEVVEVFQEYPGRILRPSNYPPETEGGGSTIVKASNDQLVGVINLMGRVFMDPLDCPFHAFEREYEQLCEETKIILVDMHAEATSEKSAMGWHIDGRVSALVGTHTHVQTADERILPQGTGFLTDAGMTGPRDSVIGIKKEVIVKRFLSKRPIRMEVAEGPAMLHAVVFRIDSNTGKCSSVERVQEFDG